MDVDSLFALFEMQEGIENLPPIGEELYGVDSEESLELASYDIEIPKTEPIKEENRIGKQKVYKSYKTAKKEIMDGLIALSNGSSVWQVFSDWVAIGALAISNIFDPTHLEERREELIAFEKQYSEDKIRRFLELFILLGELICRAFDAGELYDFLGEIYQELGLGNEKNGQFFTPHEIATFMGQITAEGLSSESIKEKGFVTVMEPASGSGSMILGFLNTCAERGVDYRTQCAVLAVDNDIRCVHMCYIQLALYGVPAVVQHGDSLSLKTWSRWYTPVHFLGEWVWRAGLTIKSGKDYENERIKCFQQPMYGFMVYGFPSKKTA